MKNIFFSFMIVTLLATVFLTCCLTTVTTQTSYAQWTDLAAQPTGGGDPVAAGTPDPCKGRVKCAGTNSGCCPDGKGSTNCVLGTAKDKPAKGCVRNSYCCQ